MDIMQAAAMVLEERRRCAYYATLGQCAPSEIADIESGEPIPDTETAKRLGFTPSKWNGQERRAADRRALRADRRELPYGRRGAYERRGSQDVKVGASPRARWGDRRSGTQRRTRTRRGQHAGNG